MMKRWLAPIALTLGLVASAVAGPALAAPNDNKPVPNSTDPFQMECPGFDDPDPMAPGVVGSLTGKSKVIELDEGKRLIAFSPGATITMTGPTGKTVSYVITGAFHVQSLGDGSQEFKATGRNILTLPEVAGPNGHPVGIFLTTGNVNFALNPDGSELRRFSGSGRVTDVCQLLTP